jgi:twitching motility protein PilT
VAGIDSLLKLLLDANADELRLGADKAPRMFARGVPKRLTMAEMSGETLRALLGDLLSGARESALRESGRLSISHAARGQNFVVTFTQREGGSGFDVVFVRGEVAAPAPGVGPVAGESEAPPPPRPSEARIEPEAGGPRPNRGPLAEELVALLAHARTVRASDVHLLEGEPPRVRVDGRLRALEGAAPVPFERLVAPALPGELRRLVAQGACADVSIEEPDGGRARLSAYLTAAGPAAALRLLPAAPPRLSELRLPLPLDDLVDLPHGLVLVCGATGSGKSTTVAAMLGEALRRRPSLLITLEDPIEYWLASSHNRGVAHQRQVGRDVTDFRTGLRDALRADPDLLLVGEMRDAESISLALTAAETGHLVFSTLHARSASSAVDRILDSVDGARHAQARAQLADGLRAVIAQRLLPRKTGGGRVVALEVLRVTHAVAALIRDGKTSQIDSFIQAGKREGMLPLERALADLVHQQVIHESDARAAANDPSALSQYLRPGG